MRQLTAVRSLFFGGRHPLPGPDWMHLWVPKPWTRLSVEAWPCFKMAANKCWEKQNKQRVLDGKLEMFMPVEG